MILINYGTLNIATLYFDRSVKLLKDERVEEEMREKIYMTEKGNILFLSFLLPMHNFCLNQKKKGKTENNEG